MKIKNSIRFFIVSALFAVLFMASAMAVEYSADAVLTGDCGEDSGVYWEIVPNDEGTADDPKYSMNIFGTGSVFKNLDANGNTITFDTYANSLWAGYINSLTRVYVGDNIKTLAQSAFIKNKKIHTIELGANVVALESAAMEGCNDLTTIYRKGNEPIVGTYDLTGITSFGTYLFDACYLVENIIFPREGSYTLEREFLKNNHALKTLYIPAACESINSGAFTDCYYLEKVYFEGNTNIVDGSKYAFHNFRQWQGKSLTISAPYGSPAHAYTQSNPSYVLDGSTYTVAYQAPYKLTAVYNGEEIFTREFVGGFMDYEACEGSETYVLFADEGCTTLINDAEFSGNSMIYAKKLFDFVGYMVRVADYNGLRAIYDFDLSAFSRSEGYSLVKVGVLGAKLYGIDPELTLDFVRASNNIIWENGNYVGALIDKPQNGIITFANTAVGYELDDGSLSASRVASDIITRAYAIIKNDKTGEERVIYSVQSVRDLNSVCEATMDMGTEILSVNELAFLNDTLALGASSDHIYTRDEALEHLTAMYNDADHILAGQHIKSAKDTVKNSLNAIYDATGELPAVISYDVSDAYRKYEGTANPDEIYENVASQLQEYARQGGLITMSAHFTNPAVEDHWQIEGGPYCGALTLDEWNQILDADWTKASISGNDVYNKFMAELSSIADFFKLLKDKDVTVFWRPYHEMNGDFFWFCGGSIPMKVTGPSFWQREEDVSADYFTRLWTKTYEYLVTTRGLDNLIWIYSPNIAPDGGDDSINDIMKYYPGDNYVDVMGLDWYINNDPKKDETPRILTSVCENLWTRLAGEYTGNKYSKTNKKMPVIYGEFGPGDKLRNTDPVLSYNGEDALEQLTQINDSGRKMGWMVLWSSWEGAYMSFDAMYKADTLINSDLMFDLAESKELLVETRCAK